MNNIQQMFNPDTHYYSAYIYTLTVASIAAAANATASANVESDSVFVWQKTAYFTDLAGAVQTEDSRVIPLVTLQITDTGTGRQFYDSVQPINNIAGQGGMPAILSAPYIFKKNSTIQGAFNNFSSATTYLNLNVSLIGFRIYKMGS